MPTIPLPRTAGIYQITCIPSGKIYIGSAVNLSRRWIRHRSELKAQYHVNMYLQRAWIKYGPDAFTFSILELVMFHEHLIEREQFYLDTLRPYDRAIGFNMRMSAVSARGLEISAETRRKLSIANTGKKHSAETRQKISEINRQRGPASEETRQRLRDDPVRKAPRSAETRQRMKEAQARRPPRSAEHNQKLADAKRGKKQTPEQIERRAAALRGKKRTPAQIQNVLEGKRRARENR